MITKTTEKDFYYKDDIDFYVDTEAELEAMDTEYVMHASKAYVIATGKTKILTGDGSWEDFVDSSSGGSGGGGSSEGVDGGTHVVISGVKYPIIAQRYETNAGVSGLNIIYDNGSLDGGSVFLPDGYGLNTVYQTINGSISDVRADILDVRRLTLATLSLPNMESHTSTAGKITVPYQTWHASIDDCAHILDVQLNQSNISDVDGPYVMGQVHHWMENINTHDIDVSYIVYNASPSGLVGTSMTVQFIYKKYPGVS